MQLSEWQLERLRDALRNFHALNSASDGSRYNWNDVVEAIDLSTGVRVPYESIRKFVSGVKQADGSYRFQIPDSDRLQAIYDFVTHPDIDLLSVEEITEREFSAQAALRLLDYLEQDFDGERILPPSEISGKYYHVRDEQPHTMISELSLSKPLENGVVQVKQVDRQYLNIRFPDSQSVLPFTGLPSGQNSEVRYGGWGIMTPEDNFFLFLKEERVGRNRYYFTLASAFSYSGNVKLNTLSLLHHDYPLEQLFNGVPDWPPLETEIARNAQIFARKD